MYKLDDDGNETDMIDYDAQEHYLRESLFGEFELIDSCRSIWWTNGWVAATSAKTDTPFWTGLLPYPYV